MFVFILFLSSFLFFSLELTFRNHNRLRINPVKISFIMNEGFSQAKKKWKMLGGLHSLRDFQSSLSSFFCFSRQERRKWKRKSFVTVDKTWLIIILFFYKARSYSCGHKWWLQRSFLWSQGCLFSFLSSFKKRRDNCLGIIREASVYNRGQQQSC